MAGSRFCCPRCGLGDFEVGHLTRPDEPYCLVCQEEDGQIVPLQRWEQAEAPSGHPARLVAQEHENKEHNCQRQQGRAHPPQNC
jgi:hypothetical protein